MQVRGACLQFERHQPESQDGLTGGRQQLFSAGRWGSTCAATILKRLSGSGAAGVAASTKAARVASVAVDWGLGAR